MQDLAIVILNFNGVNHLSQFLPSVCSFSKDYPILVIDNASTDESVSLLSEKFPQVELIKLKANFGFAGGYNEGLAQLKNRYKLLLLLNSDVEVTENWLLPLLATMTDEHVAACQPKIKSYTRKTHFEHAGAAGGYLDKNFYPFCRGRIFNHCEEDYGQYDYPATVTWTSGAAMLVRSDLFFSMGGFDIDFFAHMEEIDLCLRFNLAGYRLVCEPKSVVYHLGGGTMPYESATKLFLNFRNNLLLILKNHQGLWLPRLLQRMVLDGLAALQFLMKGKLNFFMMVFFAHMSFYTKIGATLKKRREIKSVVKKYASYNGNIIWDFYFKKIRTYVGINKRRFS